jgi:hypothetical protein
MTLLDGRPLIALPHDQLRALLKKYHRLQPDESSKAARRP